MGQVVDIVISRLGQDDSDFLANVIQVAELISEGIRVMTEITGGGEIFQKIEQTSQDIVTSIDQLGIELSTIMDMYDSFLQKVTEYLTKIDDKLGRIVKELTSPASKIWDIASGLAVVIISGFLTATGSIVTALPGILAGAGSILLAGLGLLLAGGFATYIAWKVAQGREAPPYAGVLAGRTAVTRPIRKRNLEKMKEAEARKQDEAEARMWAAALSPNPTTTPLMPVNHFTLPLIPSEMATSSSEFIHSMLIEPMKVIENVLRNAKIPTMLIEPMQVIDNVLRNAKISKLDVANNFTSIEESVTSFVHNISQGLSPLSFGGNSHLFELASINPSSMNSSVVHVGGDTISETRIDRVEVITKSTDAAGIAKEFSSLAHHGVGAWEGMRF